jgi:hypothetical protein
VEEKQTIPDKDMFWVARFLVKMISSLPEILTMEVLLQSTLT